MYQLQIKGKFNFNTHQLGLQFYKSSKVLTSVASGAYFQKSIGLVNKDGIKDGMELGSLLGMDDGTLLGMELGSLLGIKDGIEEGMELGSL